MSPPPSRWSTARRIGLTAVAAVTFIGVVVALLNDGASVLDRMADDSPASTGPSVATAPSTAGPTSHVPAASSPSAPGAVRACRTDDGEATDCQLPHRFETYDGACDTSGLIAWLGGRPDVDVPRGSVRELSTGGCEIDLKTTVVGVSVKAFDRDDNSVFRKCVDDRTQSVVTCDIPHTAEYIAAGVSGVADEDDCRAAAEDYLGVGINERSGELRVRAIASEPAKGANARCMVEVVGHQRLDQSVRNIGTSQLHWIS